MIPMPRTRAAWDSADLDPVARAELQALSDHLPLQQALCHSDRVTDQPPSVLILARRRTPDSLQLRVGVFYTGVIAGSCCADDPGPLQEITEYCQLQLDIDPATGVASITLLDD